MIDRECRLCIGDLGLVVKESSTGGVREYAGTDQYMAPEQWGSDRPNRKFDVFAFGLVLYEILARDRVFPVSQNPIQFVAMRENYRPEIPEEIHPVLREIIEKCWASKPEDRPTMDDVFRQWCRAGFRLYDEEKATPLLCQAQNDYRQGIVDFVKEIEGETIHFDDDTSQK
jgi:serine/threonine protein kinase